MFTIQAIEDAHKNVKSGEDFPAYIQSLKKMGIAHFETWVIDSHTDYIGVDHSRLSSESQYENLNIDSTLNLNSFKHYLKIHQQGETDYATFCQHCAETGIEKWIVDLDAMTCTYYDMEGNNVLVEEIPNG